jgi:hypothetical protein
VAECAGTLAEVPINPHAKCRKQPNAQ